MVSKGDENMQVCVLIRNLPGKSANVLKAVKLPEVKQAYLVFGRYDIVAYVEASTYNVLSALTSKVNTTLGVKSTESLI